MAVDDSELPLVQKLRQLRRRASEARDWATQQRFMEEEDRILQIFVSRNVTGIVHEKAGHIAEAVELYEANVADRFYGSHPYERLRVIYTREGKLGDAIRVCEAYIRFGQERDVDGKAKYQKTIEKLRRKMSDRV